MENKNKIRQTLRQKFLPYLVLKAHLFELPNTSLNDYIEELLETNPFVDEGNVVVYDMFDYVPDLMEEDIYAFLKRQVEVSNEEEEVKAVANKIIDHLDDCGYFDVKEEEFIKENGISKHLFNKALKFVQSLEPAGVGARSLSECLILKLDDEIGELEKRIIRDALVPLMKEEYKLLIKKYGTSEEMLRKLHEKLVTLDGCPAKAFKNVNFVNRFPDLIVEAEDDTLKVVLNKSSRKVIYLVENYARLLTQLENRITKEQLEELLNKARWSLHAIEERDNLLTKIGERIANENHDFFLDKTHSPKKFSLDEFAEEDFDYSTLSRLISYKYILTPRGLFPLKYFIRHKNEKFDEEVILNRIKEIVDKEDKLHPYSDEEIEKILQNEGFNIKRRTVSKYRERLNIPNSSKRKKVL